MAMSMSSNPPPAGDSSAPPKIEAEKPKARRPKYLVVALVMALLFGAGCWTEGCGTLAFYRGDTDVLAEQNEHIADPQDRERVEALYQRYLDAADAGRGRSIPFAAGIFVLGAALLALGARGLAGKSNTRSALMQVVAAQAIVVAAGYFVNKDMRNAQEDWRFEQMIAQQHEKLPADQFEHALPTFRAMRRWMPPAWLTIRSFASLLILVALSRQRSREFFEAAGEPQPDQS
jgi:hypothetical protein